MDQEALNFQLLYQDKFLHIYTGFRASEYLQP